MSYTSVSNIIKSNSISDINTSINNINLTEGWSGPAATSTNEQFTQLLEKSKNLESNLESFSSALAKLDVYKTNKEKIDALTEAIDSISVYDYDSKTGEYVFNSYNASIKSAYEKQRRDLMIENKALREEIVAAIEGIGAEGEVYHVEFDIPPLNDYSKLGELLDDIEIPEVIVPSDIESTMPDQQLSIDADWAQNIANKLGVTPEYVIANLPEGWQFGDSLIPEGKTIYDMTYSPVAGQPYLVEGFPSLDAHTAYNSKNEPISRTAMQAGDMYKFYDCDGAQPVMFSEFNGNYFTEYGPRSLDYIRNSSGKFVACSDGLYRDKDGYIVCALNTYTWTGDTWSGKTDDGGLTMEERIVATPFGLAKAYDNCGTPDYSNGGRHVDLYATEGHGTY